MAAELETLQGLIQSGDLAQFADNEFLLEYALEWAVSEINSRRGYRQDGGPMDYESRYRMNVIQGAMDWLSRYGGQELASFSENGIGGSWKEVPSWLQSVVPTLGVP